LTDRSGGSARRQPLSKFFGLMQSRSFGDICETLHDRVEIGWFSNLVSVILRIWWRQGSLLAGGMHDLSLVNFSFFLDYLAS
jgi:hypothetical protein